MKKYLFEKKSLSTFMISSAINFSLLFISIFVLTIWVIKNPELVQAMQSIPMIIWISFMGIAVFLSNFIRSINKIDDLFRQDKKEFEREGDA